MKACNGGTMFAGLLPTDINVFATTAASPTEPSWGTYCPPQDMVNGKKVGSCLGDLYSVNWMEDSDQQTGLDQTLEEQYQQVVKLTNKSHPIEYGTQTFKTTDHAKDYLAPKAAALAADITDEQVRDASANAPAPASARLKMRLQVRIQVLGISSRIPPPPSPPPTLACPRPRA
jgi:hypothetical protein